MTEKQTQLETDGKGGARPDYVAKMPMEKGRWMRVGVAFINPRTETLSVYFDVIPDKLKVVLFRD